MSACRFVPLPLTRTPITRGHLRSRSRSPAAKREPRKDAGSARTWKVRARPRTQRGDALQRPGEYELRGRGPPLNALDATDDQAVSRIRDDGAVADAEIEDATQLLFVDVAGEPLEDAWALPPV